MKSKFLPIICAAGLALPLSSHAAVVTWGTWTGVTDNTAIQVLGGYTTVEGVNFNGSTTTINNGPSGIGGTNVQFIGIAQNASGSAAGITVGSSNMDFASTSNNNSNVSSAIGSPQIWGTVLDRVIGDFGSGAEITLSGLTNGSQYYVQFFSANPDGNGQNTMKISSGGVDSPLFGTHTGGQTRYIIATFTANGSSQLFSPSGGEPHFSALVIGVAPVPEPSAALLGGLGMLGLLRRRRCK